MTYGAPIPILRVKDARKSTAFYVENFGCKVEWEHQFGPGYPLYLSIANGALRLHLSEHSGSGCDRAELYVDVSDVERLATQLAARGVEIAELPEAQPWGMREMKVRDPDHHLITFGTRI